LRKFAEYGRGTLANKFTKFYNFLANMGLVLRDDPPKVIDMIGRDWGETAHGAAEGLALSIRELAREEPRQVAGISVVMKNGGSVPIVLTVPPWIFFYEIAGLELSPYGRQFLVSDQQEKRAEVTLGPGDAIETDIPLATLYNMRAQGDYTVHVSCRLPDGAVLRSNEITIRV
jgi:hypothetical protein